MAQEQNVRPLYVTDRDLLVTAIADAITGAGETALDAPLLTAQAAVDQIAGPADIPMTPEQVAAQVVGALRDAALRRTWNSEDADRLWHLISDGVDDVFCHDSLFNLPETTA